MDLLYCAGLSLLEALVSNKLCGGHDRSNSHDGVSFHEEMLRLFFILFLGQYFSLSFYKVFLYPWYFSPLCHLPTPKGNIPFFGQAINFITCETPISLHETWMREWPDAPLIRYITVFGNEVVFCNSLNANKDVLQTHCYKLHKPPVWIRMTKDFVRLSIASMEGEQHHQHRKMLNSCFGPSNIRNLLPGFRKTAGDISSIFDRVIDSNDGTTGVFDCNDIFSKATLDIVSKAVIGVDLSNLTVDGTSEEEGYTFHQAYSTIFAPSFIGKLLMLSNGYAPSRWLPVKANRDFKRATKFVHAKLCQIVEQRRRQILRSHASEKCDKHQPNDILSFIIEETLPGGSAEGIEEEHVANHILLLISAGHDTSANMLSWSTYIMATMPEMQDTLRSEIMMLLERTPTPTMAEIESLHYLNNFIKESLRLYTPATSYTRQSSVDLNIGGIWVPKNTTFEMAAGVVQRNPLVWGDDANEFDPTRWDRLEGQQQSPFAFGVFSNGPRICLGRGFALLEMRIILIEIISKYRFLGVERPFTVENPAMVLKPKGLEVRIEKIL